MKDISILFSLLVTPIFMLNAQNPDGVGIGTNTPTEKLEVAGIVYTNQGGIKFPDNTVQTTAAYNAEPEDAAMPRGIGLIRFNGIPAPFLDTLGIGEASIIFGMNMNLHREQSAAGGGGGSGQLVADYLTVLKDIDESSVYLADAIMDNINIPEAIIYLIREDSTGSGQIYMQIELTNVRLAEFNNSLVHLGDFQFAHLEKLGIFYEEICIEDLVNATVACYNFVTQSAN